MDFNTNVLIPVHQLHQMHLKMQDVNNRGHYVCAWGEEVYGNFAVPVQFFR